MKYKVASRVIYSHSACTRKIHFNPSPQFPLLFLNLSFYQASNHVSDIYHPRVIDSLRRTETMNLDFCAMRIICIVLHFALIVYRKPVYVQIKVQVKNAQALATKRDRFTGTPSRRGDSFIQYSDNIVWNSRMSKTYPACHNH